MIMENVDDLYEKKKKSILKYNDYGKCRWFIWK